MGIFDVDDEKLKILYHRAWNECNREVVVTEKYPYLQKAIEQYVRENNCTFNEAVILAKTGKRTGSLA